MIIKAFISLAFIVTIDNMIGKTVPDAIKENAQFL